MAFVVMSTEHYDRDVARWRGVERIAVDKLPKKLAGNPLSGDHCNHPSLREQRIGGKRVYYFVYEDLKLVLLVATSAKKDQQDTINHLKDQFSEFRKYVEKLKLDGELAPS